MAFAGVLEFRRSPTWPRQAVVVAADFGIILRRPQRNQIKFGLVFHMRLKSLGRLATIAGGPAAAIDLAQDVLRRHVAAFDLDVLEHAVGEAELVREHIHRVVVVLQFEDGRHDLLAPLQRTVGRRARAFHLEACAGRQQINAVLALRDHGPCRRIGIADHEEFELVDPADRFRHPRDRVDAMPHHEHGLHRVGLADLIFRQQCRIEPTRARDPGALHQRLAAEAGVHPVIIHLPDPAPMPPCVLGKAVIEGQSCHIEAEIGSALDIGVTSEDVGAAAGMTHIAGGGQQDAACSHICRTDGELRLAHRPDECRRLFVGEDVRDVPDLRFRQAGDALDLVGRPFRDLVTDLVHAVDPLADEFLVLPTVLENVPQHSVDGGNMRSRPHAHIFGRMSRGPRHPRIDDDHIGAVELLAFKDML